MHCNGDWPTASAPLDPVFMRLTSLISWMLICSTFLVLPAAARAASSTARIPGQIVVAKATGNVEGTNVVDQTKRKLADRDVITEKYVVTTGADSRAILVFSNGATLNLGADSTLSIDEFLQDPFDEKVAFADLKEEPATSSTRLNLSRGELVGNVKHLHQDQGSSFIVNTPVGAAGIRGTTFRIVFKPDSNGRVTFTLSTSEGVVLFEAPAAPSVNVPTGKEVAVEVEVSVDAATGTITVVAPPTISAPQDIPAATQTNIAAAAQQIIEVARDVILSTTPPPAPAPQTGTPPADAKPDDQKSADASKSPADTPPAEPKYTPPENAAPQIVTPPPDVTPGAGAN